MSMAPAPEPDVTAFQARRRRAAKLTQFFGVDYRELMTEILDSIERGLEEESGRGTLNPDEVEVSVLPQCNPINSFLTNRDACASFFTSPLFKTGPLDETAQT